MRHGKNRNKMIVAGVALSALLGLGTALLLAPRDPSRRRVGQAGGSPDEPGYYEDIAANPSASASEIEQLAEVMPEAAILHPNCPPEVWWPLAEKYPLLAIQSPMFPILTLESPDRWIDLEREKASDWIEDWIVKNMDTAAGWKYRRKIADMTSDILYSYNNMVYEDINREDSFKDYTGNIEQLMNALGGKVNPVNKRKLNKLLDEFHSQNNSAQYMYETNPKDQYDAERALYVFSNAASGSKYIAKNYAEFKALVETQLSLPEDYYDEDGQAAREMSDEEEQYREVQYTEAIVAAWRLLVQTLNLNKFDTVFNQIRLGYLTKFRENFYGAEADRRNEIDKKIKKATASMERSTKEIVEILNRPETTDWPTWVTLGVVVGGVALVVLAPELFVVEAVWAAETGALTTAANIAHKIALMARTAEISEATIALGAAAKTITPEQSKFLKELAVKLAQEGVKVVQSSDIISKITR